MESLYNNENNFTEKQKEIIAAATVLFAEKGYAATSTSEIAKKAGVAEGTIFRHYKSKKELLLSIVSPMMINLLAPIVKKDINQVLDNKYENMEDFLRAMIENRTEFLKKNIHLFRILIQEIPFHPELKNKFKEKIADEVFHKLGMIISHFQLKGQIEMLPPETIIRLSASAIFGYIISRNIIAPEANWDDHAEIERTIQFIMKGLAPEKNV